MPGSPVAAYRPVALLSSRPLVLQARPPRLPAGTAAAWKKSKWGAKQAAKVAKTTRTDLQRFEAQLAAQKTSAKVAKALRA